MKYTRFYEEFEDEKRKKIPTGNVLAVSTSITGFPDYRLGGAEPMVDATGAITFEPNSDVMGTTISEGYLRENTKRISEKRARKIHPNLFKYLDASHF